MKASKYFAVVNLMYVMAAIIVIVLNLFTDIGLSAFFQAIFILGEPMTLFFSYLCYRSEGL